MTPELKPYAETQTSKAIWLGSVPSHWETHRLQNIATFNPSKSESVASLRRSERVTFLPMESVANSGHIENPKTRDVAEVWSGYSYFRQGDVILAKITPCFENGKGAFLGSLPTDVGFGSTEFMVLRPRSGTVRGAYLGYLLSLKQFRSLGADAMTGAAGQQRVPGRFVKNFVAPVPPLKEQEAIVRYLRYTHRRIAKAIRAKQRLIELLIEQKRSMINRNVTRSLRAGVEYTDSGIRSLGDIPAHWHAIRLRNLVSRVTSGSRGWSEYSADTGPLFLRVGNLTRDSIDLNLGNTIRLNLPASSLSEAYRTKVEPNDVLLSITAYIGSVAVVPNDIGEAYVNQHVACCKLQKGIANPRWLGYLLLSHIGQTHGAMCMYGGTKQGLSLDDVKNHMVLLPSLEEQDVIVGNIDTAARSIDRTITAVRREIELLREYQTRLTADVVTGQLDVREAAAALPDLPDDDETVSGAEVDLGDDEPVEDEVVA